SRTIAFFGTYEAIEASPVKQHDRIGRRSGIVSSRSDLRDDRCVKFSRLRRQFRRSFILGQRNGANRKPHRHQSHGKQLLFHTIDYFRINSNLDKLLEKNRESESRWWIFTAIDLFLSYFKRKLTAMHKPTLWVFLTLLISPVALAQEDYYFPGEKFDPAIPAPSQYLGYEIGEWHTRYDLIVKYFEKLDELSELAQLQTIGYTHEHRPKVILTLTSAANMANLEQIRLKQIQLADPSQSKPDVNAMPSIIHLGYGVHGNEPSSAEAAMLSAYWLLASQSDLAKRVREGAVVHFDPTVNPDGRDRHSLWADSNKGFPPVADPLDREHHEAWPGGRTNHYWFDLNRDWLPLAHPESQAKIEWYHQWYPNVTTDFHEMGTNSTYFFEPTKPYGSENPVVPRKNYDDINPRFAKYFAKYMDEIGALYWTKEVFEIGRAHV